MDLSKIKEIKSYEKFIHSRGCKTEKEIIDLCKSYDEQYLKITYPKDFKTIYVYVEVIKFVNNISFIINGPLVIFVDIDNEELRFTYDLHGTITILFSDNPFIEILTKKDFINQINQIKNSYINF